MLFRSNVVVAIAAGSAAAEDGDFHLGDVVIAVDGAPCPQEEGCLIAPIREGRRRAEEAGRPPRFRFEVLRAPPASGLAASIYSAFAGREVAPGQQRPGFRLDPAGAAGELVCLRAPRRPGRAARAQGASRAPGRRHARRAPLAVVRLGAHIRRAALVPRGGLRLRRLPVPLHAGALQTAAARGRACALRRLDLGARAARARVARDERGEEDVMGASHGIEMECKVLETGADSKLF